MTLKQYTVVRLGIVMALSALIAASVVRHNYLWPVIAMAVTMVIMLALRSRVKEIIADERDYDLGGKAARWAIQIFSLVSVVLMFVFLWMGERDPQMTAIAHVLAYGVCALMLLYSALFGLFRRSLLRMR